MNNFRSLYLKKIGIRLPGLSVMRLSVHKHLADVDAVENHTHSFGRILCYLSNGGWLKVGRTAHEVRSGLVAWIPAGRRHSFQEHPTRRPVCLAIDLRLTQPKTVKIATLNFTEATQIRHELSQLGRLRDPASMESRFLAAASALAILDVVFRALGFLPREIPPVPGVVRKLASLAADPALFNDGIAEICRLAGGNPDHLNRLFKRHNGITIQRHRDAARIALCKQELLKGGPVGLAAEACGFTDANYFTRWFRLQTGQSPTEFLKSTIRKSKKTPQRQASTRR